MKRTILILFLTLSACGKAGSGSTASESAALAGGYWRPYQDSALNGFDQYCVQTSGTWVCSESSNGQSPAACFTLAPRTEFYILNATQIYGADGVQNYTFLDSVLTWTATNPGDVMNAQIDFIGSDEMVLTEAPGCSTLYKKYSTSPNLLLPSSY